MQIDDTKLLTITELSDVLHMDVGTIRNRLSKGEPMPPSIKVGRRRLFPASELEKWLMTKLVSNDVSAESSNAFK
jgi:excisionase family DNA binding protein